MPTPNNLRRILTEIPENNLVRLSNWFANWAMFTTSMCCYCKFPHALKFHLLFVQMMAINEVLLSVQYSQMRLELRNRNWWIVPMHFDWIIITTVFISFRNGSITAANCFECHWIMDAFRFSKLDQFVFIWFEIEWHPPFHQKMKYERRMELNILHFERNMTWAVHFSTLNRTHAF